MHDHLHFIGLPKFRVTVLLSSPHSRHRQCWQHLFYSSYHPRRRHRHWPNSDEHRWHTVVNTPTMMNIPTLPQTGYVPPSINTGFWWNTRLLRPAPLPHTIIPTTRNLTQPRCLLAPFPQKVILSPWSTVSRRDIAFWGNSPKIHSTPYVLFLTPYLFHVSRLLK